MRLVSHIAGGAYEDQDQAIDGVVYLIDDRFARPAVRDCGKPQEQ